MCALNVSVNLTVLSEDQMIVSPTDDAKYQHRVEIVNLVLGGMTPPAISQYVSESKNTITMWVKSVDEKGFESFRTKKQLGRPPKLLSGNIVAIKSALEKTIQKYTDTMSGMVRHFPITSKKHLVWGFALGSDSGCSTTLVLLYKTTDLSI